MRHPDLYLFHARVRDLADLGLQATRILELQHANAGDTLEHAIALLWRQVAYQEIAARPAVAAILADLADDLLETLPPCFCTIRDPRAACAACAARAVLAPPFTGGQGLEIDALTRNASRVAFAPPVDLSPRYRGRALVEAPPCATVENTTPDDDLAEIRDGLIPMRELVRRQYIAEGMSSEQAEAATADHLARLSAEFAEAFGR